jgi:hypothetical protein
VSDIKVSVTGADTVLIDGSRGGPTSWLLKNVTGTAVVHLETGGGAATVANSYPWDSTKEGTVSIDLAPGQALHAISAGANQEIRGLPVGAG